MKKQAIIISCLGVAALVLLLLVSQRFWFRLDLTKHKAYTISEVSRNLYREIPDQVDITYYLSDKLSRMHPIPAEIRDLLEEYVAYSKGKIKLTVKDPAKSGMIDAIERIGIMPQQIQTVEQDQASVSTVYSGITIEYLGEMEIMPFVFSLETLEYDLTQRVRTLVRGIIREIGVIAPDPNKVWSRDYVYAGTILSQAGYRVRELAPGDEIPESLSLLMVLGGTEELDEWDLYRIDYFIQTGGRVLFALETVYIDIDQNLAARLMMDQGLISMVSYYGATVEPALVLDRTALSFPYQGRGAGGETQIRMARYPEWIGVPPQAGNPGHPVTAGFGGVDLFWTQPITLNPPGGIEAEVLFSSTGDAWLMTKDFITSPEMEYAMHEEEGSTRGVKNLAVAMTGVFPSWFEGVPKPIRPGYGGELPDMPGQARESRIIVVSDADLWTTILQYTRSEHNLDFLLQAADWLGSDEDIIGIRTRLAAIGRLDKISGTEDKLRAMLFSQALNVFIIPLAIIVVGIIRIRKRRVSAKGKV